MLSEEVKEQLEFVNNSKIFSIVAYSNDRYFGASFNELKNLIETNKIQNLSIVSFNESFIQYKYIEEVVHFLEKKGINFYLSAATSTPLEYFFNPLVNIFFWKDTNIRNTLKWSPINNSIQLFNQNNFENTLEKNHKGILSIRKQNRKRDYLDSLIDKKNFDGIYRYVRYPNDIKRNFSEEEILKYPTTQNIIQEYKKSYVSFVVETDFTATYMNPLTEKTLLAFLTKTIPIVLGGKNYIKELTDMGFYVWNDEFGFRDADLIDTRDFNKVDKFNDCINTYNKMSKYQIQDMYNSNIDKIENNYNIVSSILFDTNKTIL